MKIIYLTHEFPPRRGGVGVYAYEISKAALEMGIPFEVWAPGNGDNNDQRNIIRLNCGDKLGPATIYGMAKEILRRREALKNAHIIIGSYVAHQVTIILRTLGVFHESKVYSLLHGSEVLRFQKSWFGDCFGWPFFKEAKKIFVASEFTKKLLLQSPFSEILPEIVMAKCAPSSAATQLVTPRPKKIENEFRILTLARIHSRKGQLDIVRALSFLPNELRRSVVYKIGGSGDADYLEKIKSCAKTNDVCIDILGVVKDEDLAQVYADCDLFAMTSLSLPNSVEGFGISYIEAGWHGKASIAYNTGGVNEAVLDQKTGILVPEGETSALFMAIQDLMQNREKLAQLGNQARIYAHSFSWQRTLQEILNHLS
jgi:phosphatidylinositol alpha-1,6-mannosyltransferase